MGSLRKTLRELAAEPIFRLAFLVAPRTRLAPDQIVEHLGLVPGKDGESLRFGKVVSVNVTAEQHRQVEASWRWRVHEQIAALAVRVGGYDER